MSRAMKRPGAFLDRDGVLIVDSGYPHRPDQLVLIPGAAEAVKRLNDAGYTTVIVTNQSGHHRFPDQVTEEQMVNLMDHIRDGLWAQTGEDISFYVCYHDGRKCDRCGGRGFEMSDDSFDTDIYKCWTCGGFGSVGCDCRKPRPGLIKQALADHECDPKDAVMIGDKWSDIMAGDLAGVPGILIGTFGYENRGRSQMPRDVPNPKLWVPDLWQAAVVTVARHRMGQPL